MKKPRILSVDDEANFTELLKQYFVPRGYEMEVTSQGVKAIEMLSENRYDVVLLDLKMSGINGDEVLAEIKSRGLDVKVIFISAYCDSGKTKERLMAEGAYAFLEKPITSLKHLEGVINRAMLGE